MVALAAIGSVLSGASSFLSALGVGGSKKKSGPSWQDQRAMASQARFDEMRDKMLLAKKYGIHPLTMLGTTVGSGQVSYVDGSYEKRGVDLAALGQGIDRAANVGRSSIQRKLDELAVENARLSNDYLKVQIAGAKRAIARSGQTIPFDGADANGNNSPRLPLQPSDLVNIIADQQVSKNSQDSGRSAGTHSAFMTIDLGGGITAEVPRSDESWAEALGELPVWYQYPKIAEILVKRLRFKLRSNDFRRSLLPPWDKRRYQK